MGILDKGERLVFLARSLDCGVMKFMTAQQGALRAQGMRLGKARLPVAEMQLAFCKTKGRA